MRKSLYSFLILAVFTNNWVKTIQTVYNNEAHTVIDMDDLHILTSLVYHKHNKDLELVRNEEHHSRLTTYSPTKHILNNDKKEKSHQTQKATLSDVLMMKLVSYYEDKYKVADHEPTERGTKISVLSENHILNSENKDALKIGFGFEHFKSNSMNVPEVVIA